jgi:hypothetical protein
MDWRSQRTCLLCLRQQLRHRPEGAIIVDVEATRAIRQAEIGAARTMIERTEERLELCPERLAADSAYGSAGDGMASQRAAIEPHIPVFDKSARTDGTFAQRRSPRVLFRSRNATVLQLLVTFNKGGAYG